jgi:hypothetical protein
MGVHMLTIRQLMAICLPAAQSPLRVRDLLNFFKTRSLSLRTSAGAIEKQKRAIFVQVRKPASFQGVETLAQLRAHFNDESAVLSMSDISVVNAELQKFGARLKAVSRDRKTAAITGTNAALVSLPATRLVDTPPNVGKAIGGSSSNVVHVQDFATGVTDIATGLGLLGTALLALLAAPEAVIASPIFLVVGSLTSGAGGAAFGAGVIELQKPDAGTQPLPQHSSNESVVEQPDGMDPLEVADAVVLGEPPEGNAATLVTQFATGDLPDFFGGIPGDDDDNPEAD